MTTARRGHGSGRTAKIQLMTERREAATAGQQDTAEQPEPADESTPVVSRVASAIEGAVGAAVHATTRRWDERPGARVRRLRRLARQPLAYLYAVRPDARQANPRELGVASIDVDEIAGTAVGGATQRGADFLPLKPFRSTNWSGRWQRLRAASDRLAILPPIDVVRYADRYWVLDGHNRVALALYSGQIEIDANIVELVPPGGSLSARPASLAMTMQEGSDLRSALSRRTLADTELNADPVDPTPGDPEPAGPPGDRRVREGTEPA
jgi:hypothetical protein